VVGHFAKFAPLHSEWNQAASNKRTWNRIVKNSAKDALKYVGAMQKIGASQNSALQVVRTVSEDTFVSR
jgi:hypothetical protein